MLMLCLVLQAAAPVLQRPASLGPDWDLMSWHSPHVPPLVSDAGCSGTFLLRPSFS